MDVGGLEGLVVGEWLERVESLRRFAAWGSEEEGGELVVEGFELLLEEEAAARCMNW